MTYERLDRCTGPVCPHCGCQDAEILTQPHPTGQKSWWGAGTARCRHCGGQFHFKQAPEPLQPQVDHHEPIVETRNGDGRAVPFVKMLCPKCGSDAVKVTSTRKPVRQHRCDSCGKTFKSVERTSATSD